jgi:hypothetical protein
VMMNSFRWLIDELKTLDRKVVWVITISAFSLAGINYFAPISRFSTFAPFFKTLGLTSIYNELYQLFYRDAHGVFWGLLYWASLTIFFYFVLPIFVIKVVFKEKLRHYGLKRNELFRYFGIYALLFACIFPLVFSVSFARQFQTILFIRPRLIPICSLIFLFGRFSMCFSFLL